MSSTPRPRSVFIILLLITLTFGCSKLKNDQGGGSQTSGSASNSNTAAATSAPPSSSDGTPTTWEAKATSLGGSVGQTFTLACSPGRHSPFGLGKRHLHGGFINLHGRRPQRSHNLSARRHCHH